MASGGKSRRKAEALGYRAEETAEHWLVPIPIYSKKFLRCEPYEQHNLVTSAPRDSYQVPWISLAIPPSSIGSKQPNSLLKYNEKRFNNCTHLAGLPAKAGHCGPKNTHPNPYTNHPHRRSLSGILAGSGRKRSALTRAEGKHRHKKVPFKDAVNALHLEHRSEHIQTALAQYILEKDDLHPKELESILQTLCLQSKETIMQALEFLLKHNFLFSLIKVSYTNGKVHRKVLRDLKILLETRDDSWAQSTLDWKWNSVDRDLFLKQFQNLAIITHYKHVRRQLLCLEHDGEIALARIEQDVLLKVINDFLSQLSPEIQSEAGRSPECINRMNLPKRSCGTQTLSEDFSNVQVILNLHCTSEDIEENGWTSSKNDRKLCVESRAVGTQKSILACTKSTEEFSCEENTTCNSISTNRVGMSSRSSPHILLDQYSQHSDPLENDQLVTQENISCMIDPKELDSHAEAEVLIHLDDRTELPVVGDGCRCLSYENQQQEIPCTLESEGGEQPGADAPRSEKANQKDPITAIILYQGLNTWEPAAPKECSMEKNEYEDGAASFSKTIDNITASQLEEAPAISAHCVAGSNLLQACSADVSSIADQLLVEVAQEDISKLEELCPLEPLHESTPTIADPYPGYPVQESAPAAGDSCLVDPFQEGKSQVTHTHLTEPLREESHLAVSYVTHFCEEDSSVISDQCPAKQSQETRSASGEPCPSEAYHEATSTIADRWQVETCQNNMPAAQEVFPHGFVNDEVAKDQYICQKGLERIRIKLQLVVDEFSDVVHAKISADHAYWHESHDHRQSREVKLQIKPSEAGILVQLHILEVDSRSQVCSDMVCEARTHTQTISNKSTHSVCEVGDTVPAPDSEYYIAVKLIKSDEDEEKICLQLQCLQLPSNQEEQEVENKPETITISTDRQVFVEIKQGDAGICLTLFTVKEKRETQNMLPIQTSLHEDLQNIPTADTLFETMTKPEYPPHMAPGTTEFSLEPGMISGDVVPANESLCKHEERDSDAGTENHAVVAVQLDVDENEKVRVALGNKSETAHSSCLPSNGSSQDDKLVHLHLHEDCRGQISIKLETKREFVQKQFMHQDQLEEITEPLRVALVRVDSNTCLLKIYTGDKDVAVEAPKELPFGEHPAPPIAQLLNHQEETPLLGCEAELEKPTDTGILETEHSKEMKQAAHSVSTALSEEQLSEYCCKLRGVECESQVEIRHGSDGTEHLVTVTFSTLEDGTVKMDITENRGCRGHDCPDVSTKYAQLPLSQDSEDLKTSINQNCSVPQEIASGNLKLKKLESRVFPARKIHQLAEEAAKLEAEIVHDTNILNEEKQHLEEHLAQLMDVLESQVESQTRASTPEDIQQLQDQQVVLMKEIEAEKMRLSVVASTLSACFSSPRVAEIKELTDIPRPRPPVGSARDKGQVNTIATASLLGKETITQYAKPEVHPETSQDSSELQDEKINDAATASSEQILDMPNEGHGSDMIDNCSSTKVAEGHPNAQETLEAFQKQLAQTKEIAAVLQTCEFDQSCRNDKSTEATAIMNEGGEKLVVTAANAEKLAALTEQLKSSSDFDEPPTSEEIKKFAEYMGMNTTEDQELFYIAEWALTAPLPAGWTVHLDSEGNEFYHHMATKVSQYDHPMDSKYKELYHKLKAEKIAAQTESCPEEILSQ